MKTERQLSCQEKNKNNKRTKKYICAYFKRPLPKPVVAFNLYKGVNIYGKK